MTNPKFKVGDKVADDNGPIGTIEYVYPGENFPYKIREESGKLASYSEFATLRLDDVVNHPKHYTSHPSGIECIQVTEHMGFNLGNAIKYVWRADLKADAIEDLRKAAWYINREILKREKA